MGQVDSTQVCGRQIVVILQAVCQMGRMQLHCHKMLHVLQAVCQMG